MESLPKEFYIIVGTMVVANLGSLIGFWWLTLRLVAKGTWFLSNLNSEVKKNSKDIAAAHEKIRDLQYPNRRI